MYTYIHMYTYIQIYRYTYVCTHAHSLRSISITHTRAEPEGGRTCPHPTSWCRRPSRTPSEAPTGCRSSSPRRHHCTPAPHSVNACALPAPCLDTCPEGAGHARPQDTCPATGHVSSPCALPVPCRGAVPRAPSRPPNRESDPAEPARGKCGPGGRAAEAQAAK